jgi:peptidoglycan/LPS O-acetylase OafA/YrhL
MNYRADIQVLRAIAVLMVMVHHFELLHWVQAGYLGVDAFFVISGYLVTRILVEDLATSRTPIKDFYLRRVRRLLPALYLTLLVTTLLAPFFLTHGELESFAHQVIGAVTFNANHVLWSQAGYFSPEATTKPLLHTWSLSIEEQYYLLLPALLLFIRPKYWVWVIAVTALMSLVIFLAFRETKPGATFYLLPTRYWQLAVGSLLALVEFKDPGFRVKAILVTLATAVAVTVLVWPNDPGAFGIDSLLICGAVLVLLALKPIFFGAGVPGQWLQRIGNNSYSLYLIHWPVVAFMNSASIREPDVLWRAALFMACFPLASLMRHQVEDRFRRKSAEWMRGRIRSVIASSAIVAFLPLMVHALDYRIHGDAYANVRRANIGLSNECEMAAEFIAKPACQSDATPSVLIWGDSYAMAYASGLRDLPIIQATKTRCGPFLGISSYDAAGYYGRAWAEECIDFSDSVIGFVEANPSVKVVVLSSFTAQYLSGPLLDTDQTQQSGVGKRDRSERVMAALAATVSRLRESGRSVLFVAPPPYTGLDVGRCVERIRTHRVVFGVPGNGCAILEGDYRRDRAATLDFLQLAAERLGIAIYWPHDVLCRDGLCAVEQGDQLIYADAGHLTPFGARFVLDSLGVPRAIEEMTGNPPSASVIGSLAGLHRTRGVPQGVIR